MEVGDVLASVTGLDRLNQFKPCVSLCRLERGRAELQRGVASVSCLFQQRASHSLLKQSRGKTAPGNAVSMQLALW